MHDIGSPYDKPPRRDDGVTSASAHPELIIGEFAMRPRVHVPLARADRDAVSTWSKRMLTACALVAAAFLVHASIYQRSETISPDARLEQQTLAESCTQWHAAAGDAVSRLAYSTKDADLRQLNDAVFRMRRARRNCEEGWFRLACQDYYAVARNMPGYLTTQEAMLACRPSAGWTNDSNLTDRQP